MRILHVHSTFNAGGPQVRVAQLVNHWGDAHEHLMVSSLPDQRGALDLIAPGARVTWLEDFPSLKAGWLWERLPTIGAALKRVKPDLLLTYNWGAVDVLLANRLFARLPAVHHEEGFGPEEAAGPLLRRSLYRRVALPGAVAVVVVSRALERIARTAWGQRRVEYVPNGVDVAALAAPPQPDAIPGLHKTDDTLVVGTLAGLRREKNLPRLVRAFAKAAEGLNARLVIVGEGSERAAIEAQAAACGVTDRLVMPGFLKHPARYVGLFDVFALPSDTEQFPISLVEAMGAGVPAIATDVGDVREIVSADNRPFVVSVADEDGFAAGLRHLLEDAALRRRLGAANRERVAAQYSFARCAGHYADLYARVAAR